MDRLTDLPLDMRVEILKRLPIKDGARTCVLSKNWVNSFYLINEIKSGFHDKGELFVRFFNRRIHLAENHIKSLEIRTRDDISQQLLNSWVEHCIEKGCKVLIIELNTPEGEGESKRITPRIFLDSKLEIFEIDGPVVFRPHHLAVFPMLKSLNLFGVTLVDGLLFNRMLLGCRVLSELKVCDCNLENFDVVEVKSRSLVRFEFDLVNGFISLNLVTPNLNYLSLSGVIAKYSGVDFVCIDMARLSIEIAPNIGVRGRKDIVALFRNTCWAHSLYLSRCSLGLMGSIWMPNYEKLTILRISNCVGWSELPNLIFRAPRLEKIYIPVGLCDNRGGHVSMNFRQPWYVPRCISNTLKIMKISSFVAVDSELEFVKYVLTNARVLESITILPASSSDVPRIREFLQEFIFAGKCILLDW